MAKLITKTLTRKAYSEDIEKAGDFTFVANVPLAGSDKTVSNAIVLKCPFCSSDMMSTSVHKVFFKRTFWQRIVFNRGAGRINVTPLLQCPYNSTHKFLIKNGKVKPV